jgi:SAM-dependent methyltransferase
MAAFRRFAFSDAGYFAKGLPGRVRQLTAWAYNKTVYRSIPPFAPKGNLLDVGCGLGVYLTTVRDLGWRVRGVEIGTAAAQYAREHYGLDVFSGSFDEADLPANHFDVVTLWHVLEHFPSPAVALSGIRDLLTADGLLILGLPNFASLDRMIFKENWNGYEIPLHLYHFTPISIERLLEKNGYRMLKIVHTVRPSDMRKSVFNTADSDDGNTLRQAIQKWSWPLTLIAACLFAMARRSSNMVVYARKWS